MNIFLHSSGGSGNRAQPHGAQQVSDPKWAHLVGKRLSQIMNALKEMKELKRLKKELPKEEYKKLKGAMWILRKDIEGLKVEDLEVLKWLFKCSPILELAYKLCNELTDIFEGDYSKSEAHDQSLEEASHKK
jgi:hypothetical protein